MYTFFKFNSENWNAATFAVALHSIFNEAKVFCVKNNHSHGFMFCIVTGCIHFKLSRIVESFHSRPIYWPTFVYNTKRGQYIGLIPQNMYFTYM